MYNNKNTRVMSTELQAFKNHFEQNCNVHVESTIEEKLFPHLKRLTFRKLNCDDLLELSKYIKETFSTHGLYSHLQPSIREYNGVITLTVDVSMINEKILFKN